MTSIEDSDGTHAAPFAGRIIWLAALVALLFLASGVVLAFLEHRLSQPFLFSSAIGSNGEEDAKAQLCFAVGIAILLGLPVLRDLLVLWISLRRQEFVQALLSALGAGALLFVYALLWWGADSAFG